jgi:sulfite reductase beta subunit-like hemoprotein
MCATGKSDGGTGEALAGGRGPVLESGAMTKPLPLPALLARELEDYARDVARFGAGEMTADEMKAQRVPRGIYEQRREGTFMLRVRVPGGVLAAEQARALSRVAARHGGGTLHLTTRQNVQLHDLRLAETPDVLRALLPAGLTSKGGGGDTARNVTACPYAGVCPAERFDVTPAALAVTAHLLALPGGADLPRKFKIAFSGCGADCALAGINDVGFVARVREGAAGFRVVAGGGMGAVSRVADLLEEWVPAADTVRAAETVRQLFGRVGDRGNRARARLRFAVDRMGVEAFLTLYREALPTVVVAAGYACPTACAPVLSPADPPADPLDLLSQCGGLSVLRQRQPGWVTVPVDVPGGQIRWQELDVVVELAERFSAERGLRTTQGQALQIRWVREADVPALRDRLAAALGREAADRAARSAIGACTGAGVCRLGLCRAPAAAAACAEELARAGFDPMFLRRMGIHISGCPNACGQHPVASIGLSGVFLKAVGASLPAYRVLLGARRGEGRTRLGTAVGTVPARNLPAFLADLLGEYRASRRPHEAFADYVDRLGAASFEVLALQHGPSPGAEAGPELRRDWGVVSD